MTEKPRRLAPKPATLRELFLKSGNLCAFPNCRSLLMNENGVFIGQVCHIEAAEEGGERFNSGMTNEGRRAALNLILMCYEHHQVTNDVEEYSVAKLQEMKREHEKRFSRPDRAILKELTDWTTADQPKKVQNLNRLNEILGWNHGEDELREAVEELNEYIDRLQTIPVEVRSFIAAIASRMRRMEDTFAVEDGTFGTNILISDVKDAFQIGGSKIRSRLSQIESYGLGGHDLIHTNLGDQDAIQISSLDSGWPIWLDIIDFCERTNISIESFSEELDFSQFDS